MPNGYVSSATYQGYPCQLVEFRRSAGLAKETSWVSLRIEDLKALVVKAEAIHWRPNPAYAVPGLMGINAWAKQFFSGGTGTQPGEAPAGPKPDSGLNISGDLVLVSTPPGSGSEKETTYRDLIIDQDGIEEVLEDLQNPTAHNEGFLKVPLTDVRAYYSDYGAIYSKVNAHLASGAIDPYSVKSDGMTHWTALEVLYWLFSQLPGSPTINPDSQLFKLKLADPTDLVWEGERPAHALQQVLDIYKLQCGLLPDNSYSVWQKFRTTLKAGEIPDDVGSTSVPSDLIYEKKTVTINRRPPIVTVFGRPRIRRRTLSYVPCFHDIDGSVYQLKDIGLVWGYSYQKVRDNMPIGHEKSFEDVPPQGPSGGRLHEWRKQTLKREAFKLYVPELFFTKSKPGKGGALRLMDADFDRMPYLPMLDAPVYLSELDAINEDRIQPIPKDSSVEKGDLGDFKIIPPVVYAQQVAQNFYSNFSAVSRYFNALIAMEQEDIVANSKQITGLDTLKANVEDHYLMTQRALKELKEKLKLNAFDVLLELSLIPFVADVDDIDEKIASFLNLKGNKVEEGEKAAASEEAWFSVVRDGYSKDAEAFQKRIDDSRNKILQWRNSFSILQQTYNKYGGIEAWTNVPMQVIEPGGYSLDSRTGLVLFHHPMFHMNIAFSLDPETEVTVIEDGKVSVTFGYELKGNAPSVRTSISFSIDPNDTSDEPQMFLTGANRSVVIAPFTVSAPNLRMYETDAGTPMNLGPCVGVAAALAKGVLDVPLNVDGFEYRYPGFQKAVLDNGVSSVQHMFDGDAARTFVFVNSGNARGPLGPAERPPVATVDARAARAAFQQTRPVGE